MLLALFGIIFTALVQSQVDRPGFCDQMTALKVDKEIPVDSDINYFMRSSPQTKELGFATNLNKKKPANKILNAETGQIRDVPGFIDPVPSPDGSLLATPLERCFDPVSSTFVKDLERPFYYLEAGEVKYCKANEKKCTPANLTELELRSGKVPFKMLAMALLDRNGKELLVDSQVSSVYQSLGQFNSDPSHINYRLLYETPEGLALRDYQKSTTDEKFAPATKPKTLCGGKLLALPSLSKDGLELSAFDPLANETHVYEIGKSGKDCKLKEKFPGMLGKIDFSPNAKKLAFHIDHASATKNSIFEMPGLDQDLAGMIYDRDKKNFRQLINVEGEQSYFPVFLANDELALVVSRKNSAGESEFAISVGHLKPSLSESRCTTCMNPKEPEGQMAAFIGALVNEKCRRKVDYNYKSSYFSFSLLTPESCRSVLRTCNSNCLQNLKQRIADSTTTATQASTKNKYSNANVLWNSNQIAEIQNFDEACEKIESVSSSPTSLPIKPAGTR